MARRLKTSGFYIGFHEDCSEGGGIVQSLRYLSEGLATDEFSGASPLISFSFIIQLSCIVASPQRAHTPYLRNIP